MKSASFWRAQDLCSISNIPSQPARCQKHKVHPEPVTTAVLPDCCTPCTRINKHRCGVLLFVNKNPTKMAAVPHFGAGDTALTASKVRNYFLQEKSLFHWEWFFIAHKTGTTKNMKMPRSCQPVAPKMKCARKLPSSFPTDTRRHCLLLLSPALCFQCSQPLSAFF